MAHSSPQDFSPVRFEIFGKNPKAGLNASIFNVVGDFIDFNPQPDLDELQAHMQVIQFLGQQELIYVNISAFFCKR